MGLMNMIKLQRMPRALADKSNLNPTLQPALVSMKWAACLLEVGALDVPLTVVDNTGNDGTFPRSRFVLERQYY